MTTGARIKTLRQAVQLSQEYVANAVGISQSTLCNIESDRTTIKFFDLLKIIKLLNGNISDFIPSEYKCCLITSHSDNPQVDSAATSNFDALREDLFRLLKPEFEVTQQLLQQHLEIKEMILKVMPIN